MYCAHVGAVRCANLPALPQLQGLKLVYCVRRVNVIPAVVLLVVGAVSLVLSSSLSVSVSSADLSLSRLSPPGRPLVPTDLSLSLYLLLVSPFQFCRAFHYVSLIPFLLQDLPRCPRFPLQMNNPFLALWPLSFRVHWFRPISRLCFSVVVPMLCLLLLVLFSSPVRFGSHLVCHLRAWHIPLNTQPLMSLALAVPTPSIRSVCLHSFCFFFFPFRFRPLRPPCLCLLPSSFPFVSVPLCSRCLCLLLGSSLLFLPSVGVLLFLSSWLLFLYSFPALPFRCLPCLPPPLLFLSLSCLSIRLPESCQYVCVTLMRACVGGCSCS